MVRLSLGAVQSRRGRASSAFVASLVLSQLGVTQDVSGAARLPKPSRPQTTLPNYELASTGMAAASFRGNETHVAFTVLESSQGSDLNGDGDVTDDVAHLLELSSGDFIVGSAVIATPEVADHWVVLAVDEDKQAGIDLNGNGSLLDAVLHVMELQSLVTTNLGLAVWGVPQAVGSHAAFRVPEWSTAEDLNGDGDFLDTVVHLANLETGVVINLQQDASSLVLTDTLLTFESEGSWFVQLLGGALCDLRLAPGFRPFEVSGATVVAHVDEAKQGADLNGDGDQFDRVLHTYEATSKVIRNLGLQSDDYAIVGSSVAFSVHESQQGAVDRNGDGDTGDLVLALHRTSAGTTENLGHAVGGFVLSETAVAFEVAEAADGATDWNGDGDAVDAVAFLYDLTSAAISNRGFALRPEDLYGPSYIQVGEWLALGVPEASQGGVDLNGDGDAVDTVATLVHLRTGRVEHLAAVVDPATTGPLLLTDREFFYRVSEAGENGVDLNGDGDLDDPILHIRHLRKRRSVNLGAPVGYFVPLEAALAAVVWEGWQMVDENGDGDAFDSVFFLLDR